MKSRLEERLRRLHAESSAKSPEQSDSYKLPYYALACVLLHVRSVDGQNADLVFPLDELGPGGMAAFLEEAQKKVLEGGYRVLTDEEYVASAEDALAQRSGHLLVNAAQQLAQNRQIDEVLSGEILRLNKGREGGDA